MKKIMAKDNIELKAQTRTLQTKMRKNQEKYDEDLKILCKAKEELQNLNKEQNQQFKRILVEKGQHTKAILEVQSTNNELEQQVASLERVNLELEITIHSLENSQIRRKPESNRSTRENTSQTLDINDSNLSNTKQLKPLPQNKEKLCYACGSEKHEIKHCKSKRNIYIIELKRNQVTEYKLRKELEKYGKVKSRRVSQGKHGRKGNIGMACLATEEQAKLEIKMLNKTKQYVANECKHRKQTNNLNNTTKKKDKSYKKPVEEKQLQETKTCYAGGSKEHLI